MSVDKNTLGSLIEKQVIVIKNSGEIVSGEMIGIIRSSVLIDVNGQGVSLPLADILTMTESRAKEMKETKEAETEEVPAESISVNVLEKALIADDAEAIKKVLSEKEELLELGYTEAQITKMEKCLTHGMCRGDDLVSIATRLDSFQGNRNGTAEHYFVKATQSGLGKAKETKAYRRLYAYYMSEGRYEDFLRVGEEQELFNPGKARELVFYVKALERAGKDGVAYLRKQALRFPNEGEYIYVVKYLHEYPDAVAADNICNRILSEEAYLKAAEYALKYYLKYGTSEEFEQARKKFFVNYVEKFPVEKLKEALDIGYKGIQLEATQTVAEAEAPEKEAPETEISEEALEEVPEEVSEEEEGVLSEEKFTNRVLKGLLDKNFGLIRCLILQEQTGLTSEYVVQAQTELEQNADAIWNELLQDGDEFEKVFFLLKLEYCKIPEEKLTELRMGLRTINRDEFEQYIENYDAEKVRALVNDTVKMKLFGYSDKEVARFNKLLDNNSFPIGNSDYEVGSRLMTWGFGQESVKYHERVTSNPGADKRQSSVNQLLSYAFSAREHQLFEKYYHEKEKKDEGSFRFYCECLFLTGRYGELYEMYQKGASANAPYLLKGVLFAILEENETRLQKEMIEKLLEAEEFDFGFWKLYLEKLYECNQESYHELLFRLLEDQVQNLLRDEEQAISLLKIDTAFAWEETEEGIRKFMTNEYPLILPLLLYRAKPEMYSETLLKEIVDYMAEAMENMVNAMQYSKVVEISTYLSEKFPENNRMEELLRISSKGMDVYSMLPEGQDNYAVGKRILLLGEDQEKAYGYFQNEIKESQDLEKVALCGRELLKALYEEERYEEVIHYGRFILVERKATNYTSVALDVLNSFDALENEDGKEQFVNELAEQAQSAITAKDYQCAFGFMKHIQIFDKNHAFVAAYGEVLEKVETEGISLDSNTFMGSANIIKYLEKDEQKYFEYLKKGFCEGLIEEQERTDAAIKILDTYELLSGGVEIFDFIDAIGQYEIRLNEHAVDKLYEIIVASKNIDSSIRYFSEFLNYTDAEKKNNVLAKLEQLYEKALSVGADFDAEKALAHIWDYLQTAPSLQARICYIWILLYAQKMEEATELISLIPEDVLTTRKQQEIFDGLIDTYFNGVRPTIEDTFENKVKENTFLQIVEHCKKYKDFVMYSAEEEKIHTELLKNNQYRINASNPVVKRAVIKTIYEATMQYKCWYRYLLCVKGNGDDSLNYCINVNLSIINQDLNNDMPDRQVNFFLRKNSEIHKRYSQYQLYNYLYKLYLQKEYQKNPSVISKLTSMSKDKKFFTQNAKRKTAVAKDYIQLLKLMDDRDDYIYMKSAMFIATNNKCEEYFYDLFKKDLLSREQEICIKMCLEMLWNQKSSDRKTVSSIVEDFEEVPTEHGRILHVIKAMANIEMMTPQEERKISDVCKLLKDYPGAPREEGIINLIKKYKNDIPFAISVLELVDECYQDATSLRKKLFVLYRKCNSSEYYEKMYQNAIGILQSFASEELLHEMSRMAMLLATIMDKKGRYADIKALYKEKSLEGIHREDLEAFCDVCSQISITDEKKQEQSLLKALISEEWINMFSEHGISFVNEIAGCEKLIDFGKVTFTQDAFSYMATLIEMQGNEEFEGEGIEEEAQTFRKNFAETAQILFGSPIDEILDAFYAMEAGDRRIFADMINLAKDAGIFTNLPEEKAFIEVIVELWRILFGKEYLISQVKSWKTIAKNCQLLYMTVIEKYKDEELLSAYAIQLYESKKYDQVCSLRDEVEWANESLLYRTYFAVSLLHANQALGLGYISRTSGEDLVNIVLLLKKKFLPEEIQKIVVYNPLKKPFIEMVLRIAGQPEFALADTIEKEFYSVDKIALLKLLYSQLGDMDSEGALIERYGEIIIENNYIAIGKESNISQKKYYFEVKEKEGTKKQEKKICKKYNFVEQAQAELTLQEYADGIPADEMKRLTDLYEGLGAIRENLEYRKELLAKMIYIAKEQNNAKAYYDFVVKLGVVLFYSYASVDGQQARDILYEAVQILNEDSKRKTVEQVRECVCEMLATFESVEEITANKDKLVMTLEHLLDISKAKLYSVFFRNMLETIGKVSAITLAKDISQRTHNYTRISYALQSSIAKSQDNQLLGQTYTQWYRIIQSELKKLSKGAVLVTEVETKQCNLRGKICCVIRNMGKKPAEKISVKAIFEDGIRCRDNEKEFPILYGLDTLTFAFTIRCKEERIHKYKIELSYEIDQNVESASYNEEIRIVAENDYEHINNLYSTAPVTVNKEFYGRDREKREIFNFLNDVTYNTSMVMHGLKRVGKTSMLRYIERSMLDSQIYIPIYKSAQSVGDCNMIGNMFVKSVINVLENKGIADEQCKSYLEYNYDHNPEQLYDFYQYLQNSNILEGKRILFMADEIEEIFDNVDRGLIDRRFYKVLRVILQELISIRFIFCGADHLTDILYNHALADVFEITKRVIISRLDEESMEQMIRDPAVNQMSYTARAIERIWYYSKGHTFYSKHICSKVIDILNEESRVTAYAYDVDMALKQVMRVTEYFIYLSRFFSANDRKVVKLLCDNLKCASDKISLDTLEELYEGKGLTDSLTGLEFKDIIKKTERYDADYYQFSIEMFRLWYSKAEYVTGESNESGE